MRIRSTLVRPKRQALRPAQTETCTPEIRDRVSDLLLGATKARQRRSLEWSAAAVTGLAAAALSSGEQIGLGLTIGMAVGAVALGVLGAKEAFKAASLTIEAADLASKHGCSSSTESQIEPQKPQYILQA